MGDYAYSTAGELVAAMDGGEVSAVELTTAAIARIERLDGDINAVCVRDFDRALVAAEEADAARAGGQGGPVLGVPMTIKDSIDVAGLATTWGFPRFKDHVAAADAVAVARLRAAGAVILGKTNVPLALGDFQSYNAIYGVTSNPWDLGRTPGGSSGGSAAALAAGFGAVSMGSDIGGSLRVPAHFCGVYAHKPSIGLLPLRGHTFPGTRPLPDLGGDLGVIGPMARGAADLAMMVRLLADPDEAGLGLAYRTALRPARHDELGSFRVLILEAHPLVPVSSEVRAAIDVLAKRLEAAGVTVLRHSPHLPDLAEGARSYLRLLQAGMSAGFPPEVYAAALTTAAALDPDDTSLAAERARGVVLSHRDWVAADTVRAVQRARWAELFTDIDIVVAPVFSIPAFPHDHGEPMVMRTITIDGEEHNHLDQLVWGGIATAPGLPSTAVPVARSAQGLPIGVQLIGPLFEDHTPIRFAELLDREFGRSGSAEAEVSRP
ncbi:amidase [Winogradskya consettensis]|uniref:Amidase n=1 Tax=Winogradskya consettensis TaxID=113560 RepID=A0A919SX60_9ACTN|nr:amidase [Actinoplanes consettensis]GIM79634.1 amidase [Actinoplanes consettensis]